MKNIQNVSQYLQQFYCFVLNLRPNVSTLAFLKVANATPVFFFLKITMYITFHEGKRRVNYKMQKDKKETNYSVSIVQR